MLVFHNVYPPTTLQGILLVTKYDPVTKKQNELCQLKQGDYFGEGALRTSAKRAATIVSKGASVCLTLNRHKFKELFGERKIEFAKRLAVSSEKFDASKESSNSIPKNAVKEKTSKQRNHILEVIRRNVLFKELDVNQCGQIVNEMWLRQVEVGTSIIKQGARGSLSVSIISEVHV